MSQETSPKSDHRSTVTPIRGLYENWFLDYASYVILERAVPSIEDGLKPVQRRILHSMKQMDDGRFHKVANIIGQTMQYHPHGDASIGDALVNLGQKDLLIETQGNWGDNRTGDKAAAPRYIEAKLSKFALDVAFNPDTTEWKQSYDGRKREPITLPMKFPLLLSQGVEGIAVGLATKVMPHNFIELLKGSMDILKGKKPKIYPDFPNGGMADFSNYNDGLKGGKIRLRATIEEVDKRTLVIKDIPYSTTTSSLIDSIVKANDKGKIKIKKITDNTAKHIEILIDLPPGVSPDITIDALYAFTDCETAISPNACVIVDEKPCFLGVSEILRVCTENTQRLLKLELEIKQRLLENKWHLSSLEKIFIENRIYRDIEECETWEAVIETIDRGLDPFKKLLRREVTEEDIIRLTEIKIKRISKYDSFKADEAIKKLEEDMAEVVYNLQHLTEFAITYFQNLLDKYGKGKERKTTIRNFESIERAQVAVANQKLYVNRKDGFIGYGLKKDELVGECSDVSDIIVFRKDGKFLVSRIAEKTFVGKDIIHIGVWKKGDDRTIYNMIYSDPGSIKNYAKRFAVTAITRDKEYDLTKGHPKSKVLYFTANPNGESEVVNVQLSENCRAKKKTFEFDFSDLAIKGRGSQGNTLTKWPIRKITQLEVGKSSLGGRDIWLDSTIGRLNTDERGDHLGQFNTGDLILVLYKKGAYELTSFELTNRYTMEDILMIEKFDAQKVISIVHYHGEKKDYFVKRFKIETSSLNTPFQFISESKGSKLTICTTLTNPKLAFTYLKGKAKEKLETQVYINKLIDIKGWKALGNKLSQFTVKKVKLIEEAEVEQETKPSSEETTKETTADSENKQGSSGQLKIGDEMEWDV